MLSKCLLKLTNVYLFWVAAYWQYIINTHLMGFYLFWVNMYSELVLLSLRRCLLILNKLLLKIRRPHWRRACGNIGQLAMKLKVKRRGRGGRKAAEGAGTLVLFFEKPSRDTLLFHRLTSTPKGPRVADGRPTLALFSLKIIENPWNHWKSMKINGNHWKSMKVIENLCKTIEHQWTSMKV